MAIVTPVSQQVKLDPFNGRLFEFNNVDSRIYLTRHINTLLEIYGNDVIVEGLVIDPLSLSFNSGTNTLNFTITKGSAVVDSTLTQLIVDEAISINTTGLALSSASFAIFVNFQYLNQFGGNKMAFKTVWVDSAGNSAVSTDIDVKDRLLLGIIDFDLAGLTVSIRATNSYSVTTLRGNVTTANINGISRQLYPRSSISDNIARIILDSFF